MEAHAVGGDRCAAAPSTNAFLPVDLDGLSFLGFGLEPGQGFLAQRDLKALADGEGRHRKQ